MTNSDNRTQLTAYIVASYLEGNTLAAGEIPELIGAVHRALGALDEAPGSVEPEIERPTQARIRRSITPEAIISFEDGKPYKQLKRHLKTLDLTPEQYREKWGLAKDYPMVAPAYSARRSELAKAAGLGSRGRSKPEPKPVQTPTPTKARPKGKLGLFRKRD